MSIAAQPALLFPLCFPRLWALYCGMRMQVTCRMWILRVQVCGDVDIQLKLVPDLPSRLSAVRTQLVCSPGTLNRSVIISCRDR